MRCPHPSSGGNGVLTSMAMLVGGRGLRELAMPSPLGLNDEPPNRNEQLVALYASTKVLPSEYQVTAAAGVCFVASSPKLHIKSFQALAFHARPVHSNHEGQSRGSFEPLMGLRCKVQVWQQPENPGAALTQRAIDQGAAGRHTVTNQQSQ
eukprot:365617-Chlamydomonas_euryale.AAC.20